MDRLTITRPDDWHVHFRDGDVLPDVVAATARCFARAVVMPNLAIPVTTTSAALRYRDRILASLPPQVAFEPLMTVYLTDDTEAAEIGRAKRCGQIVGAKLYPAGATTNSAFGVTDLKRLDGVFAAMQEERLPLLIHGEVVDGHTDVFDREAVFIEQILTPLLVRFPTLPIVFEHITTEQAVAFVLAAPDNVAATITAHHLLLSRNALFAGGMRPHHYCLPVLKRETHRLALLGAALGGSPKFFLGTDSAPHHRLAKESACGCAGMYTAPAAIELYAEVFAAQGALDKLEAFASFNGPDFYGLARNVSTIVLRRQRWKMAEELPLGGDTVVPFRAGTHVEWSLVDD